MFPIRVENSIRPLGFLFINVQIKTVLCSKSSSIAACSWCRQFVLNCRHHGNIISKTIKVKACQTVNLKIIRKPGRPLNLYGRPSQIIKIKTSWTGNLKMIRKPVRPINLYGGPSVLKTGGGTQFCAGFLASRMRRNSSARVLIRWGFWRKPAAPLASRSLTAVGETYPLESRTLMLGSSSRI